MQLKSSDIAAPNRVTVKRKYTEKRVSSGVSVNGTQGKIIREVTEKDFNVSAWAAILSGERPDLIWPKDSPVKKGDEIILSTSMIRDAGKINDFERDDELVWTQPIPSVTLTIFKIRTGAKGETLVRGGVVGDYTVADSRPLYMDKSDGATRSPKRSIDLEAEYAREASEEYAKQLKEPNEARLKAKVKIRDPKKKRRSVTDLMRVAMKDQGSAEEQLSLLDEIEAVLLERIHKSVSLEMDR